MTLRNALIACAAFLAFALSASAGEKDDASSAAARKLLDPANIDKAVKPGDNFFMYANGSWLKANPIPSTETRWGSFNELQENNYLALQTLLEAAAAAKSADRNSATWKVGALYRSGMDIEKIDAAGLTPLNRILSRINNIKTSQELVKEIALEHTMGIGPLFSFYVSPDDKTSLTRYLSSSRVVLACPTGIITLSRTHEPLISAQPTANTW